MKTPSPDTLDMLDTLKLAVSKTLDSKRRLGQYAVVWKDGKVVFTEGHYDHSEMPKGEVIEAVEEEKTDYLKRPDD